VSSDLVSKFFTYCDIKLREEAERLTSSVGGSYVNAVARAQPGVRPAKSKISKTSQCARTPISNPKYNIIVRSITFFLC